MVKIKLIRVGNKISICYKIVASDVRKHNKHNFIEKLGYFSQNKKYADIIRIKYWISKGAKLSNKVKYIIKKI